jgi:hypothetical protein
LISPYPLVPGPCRLFFMDQASPFIKRIVRHGEFVPFPGMIGCLLQNLFDRLSMDLEIAVEASFAETQYFHPSRSPAGESPSPSSAGDLVYSCYKQRACQAGGNIETGCTLPASGICGHSPLSCRARGVTKMSQQACCSGFIVSLCLQKSPESGDSRRRRRCRVHCDEKVTKKTFSTRAVGSRK